ncbi:flagellin [Vogesella sp. LIG4]|uniref:flagellin N-terminal helical domain-containing protein n=1 Tax=Vogesella sp. LIG4 TaxID=1192162 RepID=UPI00081FF7AC|nr:flagellin [Vogesella sp. LIG4]SCK17420.1 flagellin [Vogesella sp. LIG4]
MLSLYTNAASLSTQSAMSSTQKDLSTSMQRLGTGYRINSAMDDAAGLQIATRLNAQVSGMKVAMRNTQNDISMLQTGEGALNEATSILTRMKDLATQSADASSSANDQTAMQAEYDALGRELNNIMTNTSFGGQALLAGAKTGTTAATATALAAGGGKFGAAINFQIGSSSTETMSFNAATQLGQADFDIGSASAAYKTPGMAGAGTELTGAANATIGLLSNALDSVGALRSAMGAAANRLDHVNNNLSNMSNNVTQAKGRIMDTDYASESANMTTKQMLMQASTAMLKQSNGMSSMAMSLLQ